MIDCKARDSGCQDDNTHMLINLTQSGRGAWLGLTPTPPGESEALALFLPTMWCWCWEEFEKEILTPRKTIKTNKRLSKGE